MTALPHDEYMAAVADALAGYGIPPAHWENGVSDDDIPDAIFTWGNNSSDVWLHGVYLIWDSYNGWRLIENGGGRNIYDLSEDSRVYTDPRQVAADARARLTHGMDGWMPGPICIDGDRWDTRATQEAVRAWEAAHDGEPPTAEVEESGADSDGWDPDDPYGHVEESELRGH